MDADNYWLHFILHFYVITRIIILPLTSLLPTTVGICDYHLVLTSVHHTNAVPEELIGVSK